MCLIFQLSRSLSMTVRQLTTELLRERKYEGHGLRRTFMVSLTVHGVVIMLLLFAPNTWISGYEDEDVLDVMTLSLGGPEGPGEGGLNPLGSQPVQEVIPLSEARRPQWIQPPTPTPPQMVLPVRETEARRRPEPVVETEVAPEEARGRTPTRGPEVREGLAMADTGAEGMGIGLSAGGLGGSGAELDVGDFCCPQYLATMLELIRRRWDNNQRSPGLVVVRFTIQRDGSIDEVGLHRGSGQVALDLSAQRAVLLTRTLPQLPSAFPESSLTVRLTFEYQR